MKIQRERERDFIINKRIGFRYLQTDLYKGLQDFKNEFITAKARPRIFFVTNFEAIAVADIKTGNQQSFALSELPKNYEIFLPLIGVETISVQNE